MPSAFAMFASVLPTSVGTPAAAPGVHDNESAGLFSSKLAEAFQAASHMDAKGDANGDAPHSAPGRLSLPVVPTSELSTVVAEPATTPALAETVDVAPDAEAQVDEIEPAGLPTDADQPETTISGADVAALTTVAQPAIPVTVPTLDAATSASSDAPAETVSSKPVGSISEAAPQTMAVMVDTTAITPQPMLLASVQTTAGLDATSPSQAASDVAAPEGVDVEQTTSPALPLATDAAARQAALQTAPEPQVAAAPTAEPVVKTDASAPQPSSTVQAAATVLKTPEKTDDKATRAAVETTSAQPTVAKADAATPKIDIKVTVQPGAVPAQSAQAAAVVATPLAVAEAIKAVAAEDQVPAQPALDAASAEAAPPVPVKTPTPQPVSSSLHWTHTGPTPTETQIPAASPQAGLGDHVAMADAASTAGPAVSDQPASVVATATDVAQTLDPTTPVDTPTEMRAPDSAAPTPQATTASSLSRATIETTAHLAAQIARKLEGRSTRFDMVLTPEDLGRVDVSLEIGSDGQLAARLAFDNPAAAAELRGRADELRRQLQDAGFQIAQDSLDFTQRDASSGGGFSDRQQQQRQALFADASRLTAQADLPPAPPPGAWTNHSQTRDRVDVRV
jgi:hypothetical protein